MRDHLIDGFKDGRVSRPQNLLKTRLLSKTLFLVGVVALSIVSAQETDTNDLEAKPNPDYSTNPGTF